MSSEDIGMGPSHPHHMVFQDEALPLRFNCSATQRRLPDHPDLKTQNLTGFVDDKLFFSPHQGAHFRRSDWNANGTATTPSPDESDDEDEDEDEEDGNVEVERLVGGHEESGTNNNSTGYKIDRNIHANTSNGCGSVHGGTDKMENGKAKYHHSTLVGSTSSREVLLKDGSVSQSANDATSEDHHHQLGSLRLGGYQDAVTIAEPDHGELYYSQYLQATEGSTAVAASASASGHKDTVVVLDNSGGFSGRKDVFISTESKESLREILSDPITGALMDDAMILPCGHSFGGGGMQHVTRTKACSTCSQSISGDSIAPNLSLRAAVQAFLREEELQFYRSSKRRRERLDQDKGVYGDSTLMDTPRGRGVQFPFAVTDRVIIKGNKRTPLRFVGREAIVTTQCLNGWYVVKTLDNAESVKLQYRSLAKVSDDASSKSMPSKMAPNWL